MKNEYEVIGDITVIHIQCKGKQLKTIIDTEDLPRLDGMKFRGYYEKKNGTETYYAIASVKSNSNNSGWSTVQLHRLLMETPKDLTVDHINNNTLDNRKTNLRNITHKNNCQNRKGSQVNSKSGIRGVHKHSKNNSWIAQIKTNGQKIYLGSFKTKEEAEKTVINARAKMLPYSIEKETS
jgi:hypothetical protein